MRSEEDLPSRSPDEDYPFGHLPFPSESEVNDPTIERRLQGPYIAGQ